MAEVRKPDVIVVDFRVDHRGVDVRMAEQALDVFDGHPVMQRNSGNGMSENVRRDVCGHSGGSGDDPADDVLDALRRQRASTSAVFPGKKVCTVRSPGSEVSPQGDFAFRVQVSAAGHLAFAERNKDGLGFPVNIRQLAVADFRDAAAGGV